MFVQWAAVFIMVWLSVSVITYIVAQAEEWFLKVREDMWGYEENAEYYSTRRTVKVLLTSAGMGVAVASGLFLFIAVTVGLGF